MKLFHEFLAFWFLPLFGLAVADAGAGGGGGAAAAAAGGGQGDGDGAAAGGSGAGAAGGAAAQGSSGASGPGAAAGAAAGTGSHLGAFIDDKGTFKAGWTKVYGLPETLEKKFTTPEGLLKSYTSLERMLGQDKVVVPGPNSTPEERAAFYEKLGRPATPEGYGIKMPEKIGDKPFPKELWSQERAEGFAKWAHERGWTTEQVQDAIEYDARRGMTDLESITAAQQQAKDKVIADLKAKWGGEAKFQEQIKLGQSALKQLGLDHMLQHPLANDPGFIEAMAKVGAAIVEDSAAGARGTSHAPVNAQAEWAKIKGDKSHPYWQKGHPNHASARAHVTKLFEQMHPEPARG